MKKTSVGAPVNSDRRRSTANPGLVRDRRLWLTTAVLVLAVAAVYGQTYFHAFTSFDDDVYILNNPADMSRFGESAPADRAALGIPSQALVVGACAQLTATKAWDDFLRVLRRLRERFAQVHGLVVGDGPLRAQLEAQCRAFGLQGAVTFTGFMGNVSDGLRCMDVYLSMSRAEGLSVGLIEAMASALPAVVTDVGGTREQVLDDVNGYVVPPGDVDRAAAAVGRLAADVGLRRKLGEAGRQRAVRMFDVSRMVAQYQDVYRSVARAPTHVHGGPDGL